MNAKRRQFAEEYTLDHNATQAAIRAGYSGKSAGSIGHELLKDPEVSQAIQAIEEENRKSIEFYKDSITKELYSLASAPATEFGPGSKLRALELLARLLGLFKDLTAPKTVKVEIGDDVRELCQ